LKTEGTIQPNKAALVVPLLFAPSKEALGNPASAAWSQARRPLDSRKSTLNPDMPTAAKPYAIDAAQGSIVVQAPVTEVYQRWLEFEEYPKFITAIKRARKLDANHFIATLAFHGKQYDATLEVMLRVPGRRLAWRTVANGHAPDHLATGVVSFESPSDRTTRVSLKLSSSFGGAISYRVDKYLHNFKTLVAAGRLP
jgi:uncharacterized membrane protein